MPGTAGEVPVEEPVTFPLLRRSQYVNRRRPLWDRRGIWSKPESKSASAKPQHRRGPKPDVENHQKVAALIRRYGEDWILDENLEGICEKLDEMNVPAPKTWATRNDGKSHTWSRGFQNYPTLVVKAIKDRLKARGNTRFQDLLTKPWGLVCAGYHRSRRRSRSN